MGVNWWGAGGRTGEFFIFRNYKNRKNISSDP
jgi:hypothetical protein